MAGSVGSLFTLAFWKAAIERAVSTFAQTLVGVWGVAGLGVADLDWQQTLSMAAVSAGVSVLKSLIVAGSTDGNPSIGSVEETT